MFEKNDVYLHRYILFVDKYKYQTHNINNKQ